VFQYAHKVGVCFSRFQSTSPLTRLDSPRDLQQLPGQEHPYAACMHACTCLSTPSACNALNKCFTCSPSGTCSAISNYTVWQVSEFGNIQGRTQMQAEVRLW
jgi:hypothetical protein